MSAVNSTAIATTASGPLSANEYSEAMWYAAYTRHHHEKRVSEQLKHKLPEVFLPLYAARRRWKDRWMQLQLPLFPGYVFVRVALKERLRVLETPGVLRLVGYGERPAALPFEQIEAIRNGLMHATDAMPHPYLTAGCRVRINNGPLQGLQGVMLRRKGGLRVILSVDLIMRSVAVDLDEADVDLLRTPA